MYISSTKTAIYTTRKLFLPLSLLSSLVSSSLPSPSHLSLANILCNFSFLPGGTSCRLFPREGVKSRNVTDEPNYYQFEVKRKRGATAGNAHGWQ